MTELISGWPAFIEERTWFTIGNFDGFHLGHQYLVNAVREKSQQEHASSTLLTFWPHPRVFLQHIKTAFYLTTKTEKLSLLRNAGLDRVITLPFNQALANLSAEEFFERLSHHLNPAGLIVSENFVLGHNREGTREVIEEICRRRGIQFEVISPYLLDGRLISSQRIRSALALGEAEEVRRLLGRPYSLTDEVREGKHLGSKLGFPTANQIVDPMKLLPAYGVYATIAWLEGQPHMAVTSVGVRPTFENTDKPNVETLLLDFDGNIYHHKLTVQFLKRLREERKFENVEALISQIEEDKAQARRILTDGKFSPQGLSLKSQDL